MKLDSDKTMRFDFIIEAAQFNSVLHRLKTLDKPTEPVEILMFEWMLKKLESLRDSLLSQGLNGINPGFGEGQVNPNTLASQINEAPK